MNLLFSFNGRIGRKKFWIGSIVYFVFFALVYIVTFYVFIQKVEGNFQYHDWAFTWALIVNIIGIPLVYIALAVSVKRLHDLGQPGYWSLLLFVLPLGFLIVPIWLGSAKGQEGPNEYGPDPSAA